MNINNYVQQKSLWIQAERNMRQAADSSGDSAVSKMAAQLNDVNEQNKLSSIITRMRTGKRLTAAEKEYLRKKSPDMYQKYRMIEAERDAYKKQLKSAKTEEGAARIHQMKMAALHGECSGGAGASGASSASGGGDAEYALCRTAAMSSEYREYKAKAKKGSREKSGGGVDTVSISRSFAISNADKDADAAGGSRPVRKLWKKKPETVTEALRKKALAGYKANQ